VHSRAARTPQSAWSGCSFAAMMSQSVSIARQLHGRLVLRVTADLSPPGGVRDLQAVAERAAIIDASWPDSSAGHVGLLVQSRAMLHTTIVDPLYGGHDDPGRAIDDAVATTWIGRATFSDAADLLGFASRLA
jgi:hypothetical protein